VNRQAKVTWAETRRLIGLDMDVFGEWPLAFGAFRASRPRWQLFCYLMGTAHMFPAVCIYRLQILAYDAGFGPVATFLSRLNHRRYGVTIGHNVRTTGGLYIAHGHVVMDGSISLGHNVQVAPFVTIGLTNSEGTPFDLHGPTIGDQVNIGTGAKVLGPIHIGDWVKIGANSVVVRDVPSHHTAVGAPARSFPTVSRAEREPGTATPGSGS
jgi:serine O-acetyltransferase